MPRTAAELGRPGLPIFSGRISLDKNPRLRWPAAGKIYRDMLDNEPAAAALWTAARTLLRTDVQVSPSGTTDRDKKASEHIEACLSDMRDGLDTKLKQQASAMFYGFDVHEIVYKRRPDGLVGWADWAIRRQETLERWETDPKGRVSAFVQRPAPDYRLTSIPLKKCIHTIADNSDGSPEGRGALRPMYRYWYMVTQFELLAGIGLERGVGFPVFQRTETVPPIQLTEEQEDDLAAQASAIRQNEQAYVMLPPGMTFRFEPMPGVEAASYLAFIQNFRVWMLSTALAEFIALGTGDTGSFALGKSKIDLFLKALTGFQDKLCDTINRQAIPQLMRFNGWGDLEEYPKVSLPAVREYDLNMIVNFAKTLHDMKAFHATPEDEEWFRKISDLHDIDLETLKKLHDEDDAKAAAERKRMQEAQAAQAQPADEPPPMNGKEEEDIDEMEEVEDA
jgi:hypothetical protein